MEKERSVMGDTIDCKNGVIESTVSCNLPSHEYVLRTNVTPFNNRAQADDSLARVNNDLTCFAVKRIY